MNRHQFMLDLLRPGISVEELSQWMRNKRELTVADIDEIINNADKIVEAAIMHKKTLINN